MSYEEEELSLNGEGEGEDEYDEEEDEIERACEVQWRLPRGFTVSQQAQKDHSKKCERCSCSFYTGNW